MKIEVLATFFVVSSLVAGIVKGEPQEGQLANPTAVEGLETDTASQIIDGVAFDEEQEEASDIGSLGGDAAEGIEPASVQHQPVGEQQVSRGLTHLYCKSINRFEIWDGDGNSFYKVLRPNRRTCFPRYWSIRARVYKEFKKVCRKESGYPIVYFRMWCANGFLHERKEEYRPYFLNGNSGSYGSTGNVYSMTKYLKPKTKCWIRATSFYGKYRIDTDEFSFFYKGRCYGT